MRYGGRQRWSRSYGPPPIGPGVIGILAVTGFFFIVQMIIPQLGNALVLNPRVVFSELKIYQLVTYLFLHGGFFHLFINLFVLFMFGRELEIRWGTGKFLFYYFFCGIGAGVIIGLFSQYPVVGASGAIYGLLLAYGVLYPNRRILLWFIVPIKAKYLVVLFAAIEFLATMNARGDGISHIGHLGGMIFGGILLAIWHFGKKTRSRKQSAILHDLTGGPMSPANVDRILDKVMKEGVESLTEDEKEILIRAGKFYEQKNHPENR